MTNLCPGEVGGTQTWRWVPAAPSNPRISGPGQLPARRRATATCTDSEQTRDPLPPPPRGMDPPLCLFPCKSGRKRQKGKMSEVGSEACPSEAGGTEPAAASLLGRLCKLEGPSRTVAPGETSVPIFCLLFARISTDSKLFVSIPNSLPSELQPCLHQAGNEQPGAREGMHAGLPGLAASEGQPRGR